MEDAFQITTKKETPGLDLKELFFKYIRFLPLFIFSVALALLGAYLYLRYTTPIYQSNGAILVKKETGAGNSGGGDQFQQLFVLDNSINIQNEIEVLQSRPLMQGVVEDLGLNLSYYSVGKFGRTNLYKNEPFRLEIGQIADSSRSFSLKIETVEGGGFRVDEGQNVFAFNNFFKTPYGTFKLVRNSTNELSTEYQVNWGATSTVAGMLATNLVIGPKGNTGTLLLTLQATHPQLAADVLNQLMQQYQIVTREDKNETNRRMIEFIDGRVVGVQRELDSVTGRLLAYQNENDLINPQAQSSSYFSQIESTDQQIINQQVQDNVAQMIANYLSDSKNANNLVPSSLGLTDATLNSMISSYNAAQLERKTLLDANVPATNARVQQRNDAVEQLRLNILESVRNLRSLIALNVNQLQQTNSNVRGQMRAIPAKEQNLMEIRTQQQTKQAVLNTLMQKREQTAISLAGTISNMKVLEPARPNTAPVKPNRNAIRLIAIAIGLALPALFIFIRELLNDKVNSRYDVEKGTDAPLVGEIGHDYTSEPLVFTNNTRGIVAEQFRIIRSNLQYFSTNVEKPVILVTSSFSGEGKSFISTNLGAVMALSNKKTIVLEFDIRKPKILSHLGIAKKPGLTNYLLGKATADELPIPVPGYDNLFVFPCGPIPPNPAELLLEPKLDTLFAYLKENFDVVIIDTAPVGIVSDAMTLSRFADSTLYIVRQGHTYKKQLDIVQGFLRDNKLPKISILLNDVKAEGGYSYYGAGRYSYGYSYGSGYFDEDAPPTMKQKLLGWMNPKRRKSKSKTKA